MLYDAFGIIEPPTRQDIRRCKIDAMQTAAELQMVKTFNMIVLGGLLKLCPMVKIESIMAALKKSLPERHHHLLPANEAAIKKGMEIVVEMENNA